MSLYRVVFILFFVFSFSSCHNRQQKTSKSANGVIGSLHIDEYKVKKGENLKGWTCYNLGIEQLCCPSNWKIVKEGQTFFTANIDPADSISYLNVTKYQPVFVDSTYTVYFKNIYKMMNTRTDEVWRDPLLERYIYDDKIAYALQFYSVINNIQYITFLSVFDRDGSTYEIVMKVHQEKEDEYKETFSDLLYLFRVNGKLIFNEDEKLKEIQQMDISKI